MLELNEVCVKSDNAIDGHTLSMMAQDGQLTCLTGGTPHERSQLLLAMLGLVPVACGYISVDGEPVTPRTATELRRLMAYVPAGLKPVGEVRVFTAPTADDVFRLRANRRQPVTTARLEQEIKLMAPLDQDDERVELLAIAALLDRPILLVDNPPEVAAAYLRRQADGGRLVVAATAQPALLRVADKIVEF